MEMFRDVLLHLLGWVPQDPSFITSATEQNNFDLGVKLSATEQSATDQSSLDPVVKLSDRDQSDN